MVMRGVFTRFVKVALYNTGSTAAYFAARYSHRELLLRSWSSCMVTLDLLCTINGKTSVFGCNASWLRKYQHSIIKRKICMGC